MFLRSRWITITSKHSRTAPIDYFNVFTVKQREKILALSDSGNLALLGLGLFPWSNQSFLFSSSNPPLSPPFLHPSLPHPFCIFPSCYFIASFLSPICTSIQLFHHTYVDPTADHALNNHPSLPPSTVAVVSPSHLSSLASSHLLSKSSLRPSVHSFVRSFNIHHICTIHT